MRATEKSSTEMADRLWTAQDVGEYLGVSAYSVYNWRANGTGPPGRLVGSRLRFRPQDVREWVESLSTVVGL